ncbi:MAG TPA: flavodoxin family protein [Anaerolineales bacterium]|nr:flavodoxin family protein [Anaerolineales bacterium]
MGRKLLILKGSPREAGNSAVLADRVSAGAADAGWETESVSLQSMDIRACDGCDLCRDTGEYCVIDDDMQGLYPKLIEAGALLLASPIYWFTYSAQLKLCIDRWYGLWSLEHDVFRGKPVGIVLTYADTDLYTSGGINAIHTFESMFRFLNAPIVGMVYGSVSAQGDAAKHPDLLKAAYDLGRRIAECAEEGDRHALLIEP